MMNKKFDDEAGMENLIAVAFKYPHSERIAIMGFLADYAHEYDFKLLKAMTCVENGCSLKDVPAREIARGYGLAFRVRE
ncbi:MAG: hypothetical protein IJ628_01950 [Bacteroidaceae bacterium]|nr:hypothetical protein [Bacteroidaceae bacterium]